MSSPSPPPPPPSPAPALPKAVAFVDAQNLIHDAERSFGYDFPNFDIKKLCHAVCLKAGWAASEIRLYTGVPSEAQNWRYKVFWEKKIFEMKRAGIEVIWRKLKDRDVSVMLYRNLVVRLPPKVGSDKGELLSSKDIPWVTDSGVGLPEGTVIGQKVFTEKGIDVSIAVDAIRYALEDRYQVCLFFSQDTDLDPAVQEIKLIGKMKGVGFTLASAFPSNRDGHGIPGTMPLRIDRATYDACIDPRDYFPKGSPRRR